MTHDREPLPTDGPDFHVEHAMWEARQRDPVPAAMRPRRSPMRLETPGVYGPMRSTFWRGHLRATSQPLSFWPGRYQALPELGTSVLADRGSRVLDVGLTLLTPRRQRSWHLRLELPRTVKTD